MLAILLIAEIFLLLAHMGLVPFFERGRNHDGEKPAGQILRAENDLRRRGADSLVWENSSESEPVYFHDSVLTLAQSEAVLELGESTRVHMTENTLVTIEPSDKDHPGEIRLRFRKGGIRANNPSIDASVTAEDWSLDIKKGSDVDLRQNGDIYEAVVHKGEAQFSGPEGTRRLAADQILQIHQNSIVEMDVDLGLEWTNPPPSRVYTHAETAAITLHWKGSAGEISHQWLEHNSQVIALDAGATEKTLELGFGRHTFQLRNASGGVSLPFEVQVWKAPILHLLSPLPRDRVQIGNEISFFWTFMPGLKGYRFEFKGHSGIKRDLGDNTFRMKFDEEDDAEWGVTGFDRDGFEIPPPYRYPIFVRQNPFAPPKLKGPSLRKPAHVSGKVGWWNWLLPAAEAEEAPELEAVFAWEPVDGADQYVIEIADAPDFRHPLIVKSQSKPEFVWRTFPRMTLYWRVAAGSKRGRMGMFTDVAVVHFENAEPGDLDGVQVRKREVVAAIPTPAPAPPPPPPPPPPAPVAVVSPPPPIHQNSVLVGWRPAYVINSASGEEQAKAHAKSGTAFGLMASYEDVTDSGRIWRGEADFGAFSNKPDPPSEYPLQNNIDWEKMELSVFTGNTESRFSYGGTIQQNFGIQRASNQTVSSKPSQTIGPAGQYTWRFGTWTYMGSLAALVGTGEGISTKHEMRWTTGRIQTGAGFDAAWITHSAGSDSLMSVFFLLGTGF